MGQRQLALKISSDLSRNTIVNGGDGINISASEVTLDLNGFTIASTASAAVGKAIYLALADGNTDITILNGHIKSGVTNNGSGIYTGSGFTNGISHSRFAYNVRVSSVSELGCPNDGIDLSGGNSTVVESCTVKTIGIDGISADSVSRCTAKDCEGNGIAAVTVSDCTGEAYGNGIVATTVNNCYGDSVGLGNGILASTANNCYGQSVNGIGIWATGLANACQGQCTSGVAIKA